MRQPVRRDARFGVLLGALWAVPLALLIGALVLVGVQDRAAVTTKGPAIVAVGSQTDEQRQPVAAVVEQQPGGEVLSRIDGLVTAVVVTTPAEVEPGLALVRVNDVLVRAQPGGSPLVGDVAPGARGADIARVRDLLSASGYDVGDALRDTYSFAIRSAIDAWNADAGLPRDGVFRVASTAFVADDIREIADIAVSVGDRVTVDAVIARGADNVERVTFASVGDQPLADYGDAAVVLLIGSQAVPVDPAGVQDEDAVELTAMLRDAANSGQASISDDAGTLRFGSVSLALANPATVATVPTTALRVDTNDRVCVFVVNTAATHDSEEAAILGAETVVVSRAEPRPGSPALTIVDGSLAGASVVADASRVPADRTCAST